MASNPRESVPSRFFEAGPVSGREGKGPSTLGKEPVSQNIAVLISVMVHGMAIIFIGLSALLTPHRPSAVPVFEIVNLEKPKLRPLTPKTVKPPEPPPPEPEPVKPPEAPKLTPKPTNAVQPKKPEPKVTKPKEDDEPKPVKEVVQEQQVLPQPEVSVSVPQDPRLSFWAARVKKKVDQLWHPPTGIDVAGKVKAVITFKVSREGTITSQSVSESSGNSSLDDLALMTIKRLETVPPIPPNFPNDEIEVGCEFLYQGQ
ncbi:MAG: TonB family protein [Fibrobacteria bacterium]